MFTLKIKNLQIVAKLKSVDYFFHHSSFHPQIKTSTDYQNNFKLTYKGWGCLDTISVYLHYKVGARTDTIRFPMCKKTKFELKRQ